MSITEVFSAGIKAIEKGNPVKNPPKCQKLSTFDVSDSPNNTLMKIRIITNQSKHQLISFNDSSASQLTIINANRPPVTLNKVVLAPTDILSLISAVIRMPPIPDTI